jgi:16S rRNA G1207 methylase RsmC
VTLEVGPHRYQLVTGSGVFAGSRLDAGTKVLLREAPDPPPGGTLLDLGCGYGPIAISLAARAPRATVWAVDVNERALALTAHNAASAGFADRVHVASPQQVPAAVGFDEIWSNPPIRVGKQRLHGLLTAWLPRLRPGGVAWLVVSRHLGADSLAAWLRAQGWAVTRRASSQGYRVLEVRALTEAGPPR